MTCLRINNPNSWNYFHIQLVKPALRGHLLDKEKAQMKFTSYIIFYEIFDTGDCLIEVTAWTGFTVYLINHVSAKAISEQF